MGEWSTSSTTVWQALILAAGNGDRFRNGSRHSKLLTPVAGTPLLTRTLQSARAAGVAQAHLVLGYDAPAVKALAERSAPPGLALWFHHNDHWHEENGLSVLTARDALDHQPFALMMGDHLFEPAVLHQLMRTPTERDETLLGIDRRTTDPDVVAEATKVQLSGDHVQAIGKALDPYDALDTGLFVCQHSVFGALAESCRAGDSTLSGGIRRLASRGLVRGVDIGDAQWCDIDTTDDLRAAERLVTP